MSEIFPETSLEVLSRQIDEWLASFATATSTMEAHTRDAEDPRRWYIRMSGESKEHTTIWLHLGQRTLRYETYVMPAPEENAETLWENLLRRNEKLTGAHFSIGVEDAVFLRGEIPLIALNAEELDRAIGTLYQTVEQVFPTIIRIGFASRFR